MPARSAEIALIVTNNRLGTTASLGSFFVFKDIDLVDSSRVREIDVEEESMNLMCEHHSILIFCGLDALTE